MNEFDFAEKVMWEGGVDAALEYGLTAQHLDSPDSELGRKWTELAGAYAKVEPLLNDMEEYLEEVIEND